MAAALSYAVAGSGVANQLVTSGNCTLHASKRCLFSTRGFRCQAEKTNNSGETQPQNSSASPLSPSTPPVSPPPPPPAPKATKPNLADVFAFGGPGPERINGRLAMVGFVSAVAVEVASGQDLADQLAGGGGAWFLGTAAVLSLASLIPLLKGITAQARSGNLMSSDAELWNGRFAMLGLVALGFTEYLKGGPLV